MKYAGAEKRVKKKEERSDEQRETERKRANWGKRGERERRGSGDDEDGDDDDDDGSFLPWSELFAVALGSPRAEGGNKTNGNARR